MTDQTMPKWEIRKTVGFAHGRPTGFMVSRIFNPYTHTAYEETLRTKDGRTIFRTLAQAEQAIKESGQ